MRAVHEQLQSIQREAQAFVARHERSQLPKLQQKMPYNILMGIRRKQRAKTAQQKSETRESQVLYDSFAAVRPMHAKLAARDEAEALRAEEERQRRAARFGRGRRAAPFKRRG